MSHTSRCMHHRFMMPVASQCIALLCVLVKTFLSYIYLDVVTIIAEEGSASCCFDGNTDRGARHQQEGSDDHRFTQSRAGSVRSHHRSGLEEEV